MIASSLPLPAEALRPPRIDTELTARLRKAGLRVTDQRVALLALLSQCPQPVTIDRLFELTGADGCDLVTIYRTMSAFERASLVYRSGFSDRGAALYSIETGSQRRYPLVRKGSAVVEHLDEASTDELQIAINNVVQRLKAKGYGDLDYIVEFFVHEAR
ncbi:MAG: transcriptional repressor [Opitutaceae bacterium]|nr:transcriptional repressor [Opitutaceae bacterium]